MIGTGIPPYGMVKPYNQSFPPIQVDWSIGRLQMLGEFVASRGSDVNWFTYSFHRVEPGLTADPNFESPFTFYDLAGDDDGIPELAGSCSFACRPTTPSQKSRNIGLGARIKLIRYSWDQTNSQQWSYKLGLLGQQQIDTTVSFPEFTLRTIPYDQLSQHGSQSTVGTSRRSRCRATVLDDRGDLRRRFRQAVTRLLLHRGEPRKRTTSTT